MTMITAMRPTLEGRIVAMREEGASNETIARYLRKVTKMEVGREVVRRWFIARDEAKANERSK